MPTVSVLQLHPIKALDPVFVSAALVLPSSALEFDRRWALADSQGGLVSGKRHPHVHGVRATFDLARHEVNLEGQVYSLMRQGREIAIWFSDRFGERLEWRENPDTGFPDDVDSPGPTVVSTASLDAVAEWFDVALEQTRRRFRTNIEVEGVEAFWEDGLYGSSVQVGSVELYAVNPCQRCVVPSRDPMTGVDIPGFQRRFADQRRITLPAWARRAPFNHFYRFAVNTRVLRAGAERIIRVGDTVRAGGL